MTENEFILQDRITKIQSVINKYGEDNFSISFSGGKDSTVLHYLIDMAIPGNNIPRVYANTGIELNMIRDFVIELSKTDPRINIIKPAVPIKKTLEQDGYPFKSKMHASIVKKYQKKGFDYKVVRAYIGKENTMSGRPIFRQCPKKLLYQFSEENTLKISDMCCVRLKEEPLENWQKEHNKPYVIIGVMRAEGGRRENAPCMTFNGKKLIKFQPLAPIDKAWESWFIETYNIDICDIYKPPYNFDRTGCKGCPFGLYLQHELDILEKFFPAERKQCELIWAPVYKEYRRLGYRLNREEEKEPDFEKQITVDDLLKDNPENAQEVENETY